MLVTDNVSINISITFLSKCFINNLFGNLRILYACRYKLCITFKYVYKIYSNVTHITVHYLQESATNQYTISMIHILKLLRFLYNYFKVTFIRVILYKN